MTTTTRDKANQREQLLERARAITPEVRAAAEAAMQARLLALPEIEAARGVLVCLSYGIEPETRPLIGALTDANKQVYLPRADRADRQLHVHAWPCELQQLRFGLQQPSTTAAQLAADEIMQRVDVAVILGLGFDHDGVRLGHGSGYVDRFLAAHAIPAIALTFEAQLVERLPRATYDIPMAVIVSEDRVLRPPADSAVELRRWLGLDHAEIDALLRRAIESEPFDAEAFAGFRERLLRHIGIEERLLFPAVRRASDGQLPDRAAALRIDHAALTSLLVPTPDRALAREIAGLLEQHNVVEEQPGGVYDECLDRLDDATAAAVLHGARTRRPVPTTKYFDGPGTVRTAAEALRKAGPRT